MSNQWYVRRDGKIEGPLSNAELRQQAATGQITPVTELCQAAGGKWIAASCIRDLFKPVAESFPAPPPLPTVMLGYAAPPPISAFHPAHDRSDNAATDNDRNSIQTNDQKQIPEDIPYVAPWYGRLIGLLLLVFIYWLIVPSGCRKFMNERQQNKPPAKAQVFLLDAEDAWATR